jgi:hypothetical protein
MTNNSNIEIETQIKKTDSKLPINIVTSTDDSFFSSLKENPYFRFVSKHL